MLNVVLTEFVYFFNKKNVLLIKQNHKMIYASNIYIPFIYLLLDMFHDLMEVAMAKYVLIWPTFLPGV